MSEDPAGGFDALDEERRVERRASYLERTTTLSGPTATAVAWSEEGYSVSGIAAAMGSTPGTVRQHLDRVTARYGVEAVGAVVGDRTGEETLGPVTPDVLAGYSDGVLRQWAEYAADDLDAVDEAAIAYADDRLRRSPFSGSEDAESDHPR